MWALFVLYVCLVLLRGILLWTCTNIKLWGKTYIYICSVHNVAWHYYTDNLPQGFATGYWYLFCDKISDCLLVYLLFFYLFFPHLNAWLLYDVWGSAVLSLVSYFLFLAVVWEAWFWSNISTTNHHWLQHMVCLCARTKFRMPFDSNLIPFSWFEIEWYEWTAIWVWM